MQIISKLHSWLYKEQSLLGIDVGKNFIRIVELSKNDNTLCLVNCAKIPIEGKITDSHTVATIRTWLDHNAKSKNTATAVAAIHALFKKQHLANHLTSRELKNFISFNLSQAMNLLPRQISYDYKMDIDNQGALSLATVALEKKHIDFFLALGNSLNLRIKIVDLDIYALARAICYNYAGQQPMLVVNIEEHRILYIVLDDSQILLWAEETIDMNNLTSDFFMPLIIAKIKEWRSKIAINQLILGGNYQAISAIAKLIEAWQGTIVEDWRPLSLAIANPLGTLNHGTTMDKNCKTNIFSEMLIAFGLALRVNG